MLAIRIDLMEALAVLVLVTAAEDHDEETQRRGSTATSCLCIATNVAGERREGKRNVGLSCRCRRSGESGQKEGQGQGKVTIAATCSASCLDELRRYGVLASRGKRHTAEIPQLCSANSMGYCLRPGSC